MRKLKFLAHDGQNVCHGIKFFVFIAITTSFNGSGAEAAVGEAGRLMEVVVAEEEGEVVVVRVKMGVGAAGCQEVVVESRHKRRVGEVGEPRMHQASHQVSIKHLRVREWAKLTGAPYAPDP